jgi:hypothetical protein
MSIIVQRDATVYSFIIFLQTDLHVSDDILIHYQEHIQTVITSATVRTVFATVRWRGGVRTQNTSADGSKYGSTSARCCNYSLRVLLIMEVSPDTCRAVCRNIIKFYIVASHRTIIDIVSEHDADISALISLQSDTLTQSQRQLDGSTSPIGKSATDHNL